MTPSEAETILAPTIDLFNEAINSGDFEKVMEFYDDNAVLIHKDKEAKFGKDEIKTAFAGFSAACGKTETRVSEKKFEGSENYVIYNAFSVCSTASMGDLKAHYTQIWKKSGERFLIIQDMFEPIP